MNAPPPTPGGDAPPPLAEVDTDDELDDKLDESDEALERSLNFNRMEGAGGLEQCASDMNHLLSQWAEVGDDDDSGEAVPLATALSTVASELGDLARARAMARRANETDADWRIPENSGAHGFGLPDTDAACGSTSTVIQPPELEAVRDLAAAGGAAPEGALAGPPPQTAQPTEAKLLARVAFESDTHATTAARLEGLFDDTGIADELLAGAVSAAAGGAAQGAAAAGPAEEDESQRIARFEEELRILVSPVQGIGTGSLAGDTFLEMIELRRAGGEAPPHCCARKCLVRLNAAEPGWLGTKRSEFRSKRETGEGSGRGSGRRFTSVFLRECNEFLDRQLTAGYCALSAIKVGRCRLTLSNPR